MQGECHGKPVEFTLKSFQSTAEMTRQPDMNVVLAGQLLRERSKVLIERRDHWGQVRQPKGRSKKSLKESDTWERNPAHR